MSAQGIFVFNDPKSSIHHPYQFESLKCEENILDNGLINHLVDHWTTRTNPLERVYSGFVL